MKKTIYKFGAAISTLSLLATSFAGVAGATVTGTAVNSTTGADSYNESEIEVEQTTFVDQSNNGVVINEINLSANTGDNEASKNTGEGDIKTGDVSTGVGVSNSLNQNVADLDSCGGCDMDLWASNEKTGADSKNEAEVEVSKETILNQNNKAFIHNDINQKLNTGGNEANKNTGMGNISTGDIGTVSLVENAANRNVASTGGGSGTAVLSATNDTTGADSKNEAEVEVKLSDWVVQNNVGFVSNDVEILANTGWNEANKNTGEGHVKTGDIDTGVGLSNSLNSNFLAFDGCCDIELGVANHKTGYDSKNEAEAELKSKNVVFQTNCEGGEGHGLGILGGNFGHHFKCGVVNLVGGKLNTGDNETNKNTADGIDTGDIDAAVEVFTEENENILGSTLLDLPDIEIGEDLPGGAAWWLLFFGFNA